MNHNCTDEHQLVNALQGHTVTDFTLLYRKYAPTLYGVLLRLVNDPLQAQDLLQDTFLTIWLTKHRYDPTRGRLFTWFLTLARHIALDALKANQRRQLLSYSVDARIDDSSTTISFEGRVDGSLLSDLTPKYRLIVELVYLQGYTAQEVADQLHLPLGTVKTRLRSALQQLRVTYAQDIYYLLPNK